MGRTDLIALWMKRNENFIWATLIFFLSLTLRLYNFEHRFGWFDGVARDILVGRHIVLYREFPNVGPASSFLGDTIYYPPYYFYLIAIVSIFVRDAISIIKIFVVFESALPVIIFFIGLRIGRRLSAIIASLWVALSAAMIESANLWSPYIGMLIFYLGVLLLITGERQRRWQTLMGIVIIFFSTTVHFSLIVSAGIILLWLISRDKSRHEKIQSIFLILISAAVFYSSTISLYFGHTSSFISANIVQSVYIFLSKYFIALTQITLNVFHNNRGNMQIGIFIVCVLAFCSKDIIKVLKTTWWALGAILLTPMASALLKAPLGEYVYTGLIPIIFFLIANIVLSDVKVDKISFIKVILLIWLTVLLVDGFSETTSLRGTYFRETEGLAESIVYDETLRGFNGSFQVYVSSKDDYKWSSALVWYFLETKYNIKTVHVVDQHINLKQEESDNIYLVCRGMQEEQAHCKGEYELSSLNHPLAITIGKHIDYTIYLYNN